MADQTATHARRVEVSEPIVLDRRYEYADAFEVHVPEESGCTPAHHGHAHVRRHAPRRKRA